MKKKHGLIGKQGNRTGTGSGKTEVLAVRVKPKIKTALKTQAARAGVSVSTHVETLVTNNEKVPAGSPRSKTKLVHRPQ